MIHSGKKSYENQEGDKVYVSGGRQHSICYWVVTSLFIECLVSE